MIFEDHSSHGADDPVAVVALTVECHPGEMEAIKAFLANVQKCAGVYWVSAESKIKEVVKEVLSEEDHGQRFLQQADQNDQAAGYRTWSAAPEGPAAEVGLADEWPELAGPAGAVPEAGPLGRGS